MLLTSNTSVTGALSIVKNNSKGLVVDSIYIPNLVVTAGKNLIANRLVNNSTPISHMAVGSGTTSPLVADTALQTQLGARVALTSSVVSTNTITYTATFAAGVSTGAITEAGLFNDATNTTTAMLSRTTFPVINKEAGDSITITWVLTIA